MYYKKFYRKNILITGGLGFVGSNLAHELVRLGANVSIIDSLSPYGGGNKFNIQQIKNKIELKIADAANQPLMNRLVKGKDFIFNLVGQVSHILSMKNPFCDLEANCRTSLVVLEACRKYNPKIKIVFSGTRSVYGRTSYLPINEQSEINPIDINSINKLAAEKYHLLYYKAFGIRTVVLRLTNTYGPHHQMRHREQGFINWFIRLSLDNRKIKIYGDGRCLRVCNYIDDVLEALILAATDDGCDGEVFNLGDIQVFSVKEIAQEILKITKSGRIQHIPYPEDLRPLEIGNYNADFSKIHRQLGWYPRFSLQDGLKQTIEFYKKFKHRYW